MKTTTELTINVYELAALIRYWRKEVNYRLQIEPSLTLLACERLRELEQLHLALTPPPPGRRTALTQPSH